MGNPSVPVDDSFSLLLCKEMAESTISLVILFLIKFGDDNDSLDDTSASAEESTATPSLTTISSSNS